MVDSGGIIPVNGAGNPLNIQEIVDKIGNIDKNVKEIYDKMIIINDNILCNVELTEKLIEILGKKPK